MGKLRLHEDEENISVDGERLSMVVIEHVYSFTVVCRSETEQCVWTGSSRAGVSNRHLLFYCISFFGQKRL